MATERAPLTRARIAHEALALIDAEGLAKLSMRRLAGRLEVEAMSLYHHVGDKSELLVVVADLVLSEIAGSTSTDWGERITDVLGQFRAACLAHPGAMPLVVATGFTTPSALGPIDTILGALEQAGLDERQRVRGFRLLLAFSLGSISCELAESTEDSDDAHSARSVEPGIDSPFTHLDSVGELLWNCDHDADFSDGLRQVLAALVDERTSTGG